MQHVARVRLVALPKKEVPSAPLALLANTLKHLPTHVLSVQKVTCRKAKTVPYVQSVAQKSKEKAAKQEILLVRHANLASTKLHQVSVKIARQDSTLMAKVRKVVRNVLMTPTCLSLESRRKQTAPNQNGRWLAIAT